MSEPDVVPPALLGCIDRSLGNFEDCVEEIYNTNINNNIEPGSQYYSSAHRQIAGLMAINAMGEDWGYALGNWIECKNPTFNKGDCQRRGTD